MTVLVARNLSIGHGATVVATSIDLSLAAGSVTCLLGPNGVGKTTLFRTLLGLIPPLAGKIEIAGDDLSRLPRAMVARHVAYVPQAYLGDLTHSVLDLVLMGRTAHLGAFAVPGKADLDLAMRALEALGLASLAGRQAGQISGGQRQLALIARALAQHAALVVMDEPTASLDLANRVLVLDRIGHLAADGLAVLLSTHEPEQAFALANEVAILGPNNRFETGPVDAILTGPGLSELYGLELAVERTASGRRVVSVKQPWAASPLEQ